MPDVVRYAALRSCGALNSHMAAFGLSTACVSRRAGQPGSMKAWCSQHAIEHEPMGRVQTHSQEVVQSCCEDLLHNCVPRDDCCKGRGEVDALGSGPVRQHALLQHTRLPGDRESHKS